MTKIVMIVAGSAVFSLNLAGDILQMPEFRDCTIAYMGIDRDAPMPRRPSSMSGSGQTNPTAECVAHVQDVVPHGLIPTTN